MKKPAKGSTKPRMETGWEFLERNQGKEVPVMDAIGALADAAHENRKKKTKSSKGK